MPIPGGGTIDLYPHDRELFVEGAVWGAALVAPTREQIAEAINTNADVHDDIYVYETADAVLALITDIASGD